MSKPIVFLSFAHTLDNHLPQLETERQTIAKYLRELEDNDHIRLLNETLVTRDILSNFLSEYRERIVLFHYAGHAESDKLVASDGAAYAEGLAELLGRMPNLRLVFLNGCSTKGQVEQLLKAGVKVVIGTSSPVNDDAAMQFSIEFYKSMTGGKTIDEAFGDARRDLNLKRNNIQIVQRGIKLSDVPTAQMPWGIFEREEGDLAQWRLPTRVVVEIEQGGQIDDINEGLRENMFHVIARHDSTLATSLENQQRGERQEPRVIQQLIIDALPVPLGQEIRRIFSTDVYSLDRVGLLLKSYRSLLQLLTYSLIAQLWDLLYAKPDHPLNAELKALLKKFLVTADEARTFNDYVGIIKALRLHFTAAGVNIFIDELTELSNRFNTQKEMQDAHQKLEDFRRHLSNNPVIEQLEMIRLNQEADASLAVMFQELGILCRYKFVTIKDIDLIKKRHRKAEFRIQKVNLDRLSAGLADEFPTEESFTDNHAVVLLKSARSFDQYLNLSPFLIDEHALIKQMQKSKLFMFSSFDEDTGKINYHMVLENNPHAQLNAKIYPAVMNEFMAFKQAVLD